MKARIEIVVGRIETLSVDAVVNAANRQLLPGGGVDGALRRAAGAELTKLTQTMAAIEDGEAVITPGFNAPASFIIHTAAPVWFAPGEEAAKLAALAACYRNCLALAERHALKSIAFPCLGTGIFAWPKDIARDIAADVSMTALANAAHLERLLFCCFSEDDAALYRARFR